MASFGVEVEEYPGWEGNGADPFEPVVLVGHHTASAPPTEMPSLGTILNGRPDLAPPLANALIGRSGRFLCTASGRANHAGSGSYKGVAGNTFALGYEVENAGTGEVWSQPLIMRGYVCGVAGGLAMMGRDASYFCRHAEWAGPRKIDPWGPWWDGHRWEQDADHFRELVQITLNTGGLDVDTLGRWMQEQANRVITALTAVVNGRRSDSLFVVRPQAKAARPGDTWSFNGQTRRHLTTGQAAVLVKRFNARRVLLTPAEMAAFKAAAPEAP